MANSEKNDVSSLPTSTAHSESAHVFYNNLQAYNLDQRNKSKILYLRNFNNWIKSTLIDEYLCRLKLEKPDQKHNIRVFDMGCGKGGDQPKWQFGGAKFVTFADLAENSVEECKQRFYGRRARPGYTAEFYTLDCTKELIRDKIQTDKPCFDLVSTQFVLHYSFDRLESAKRFLRNAAECLQVGGYFIGTTVNSCELVERCRKSSNQSISNDVFSVRFDPSINLSKENKEPIPLFGAKYHFSLDDVVDCPEYLVYFPLLEKLANSCGLVKVDRQTFQQYFNKNKDDRKSRQLLERMNALEYYEIADGDQTGQQHSSIIDHSKYAHAAEFINKADETHPVKSCRTLSKHEWDMISLYIIFAFKKEREVRFDENDNALP